jgi:hypothetical protein
MLPAPELSSQATNVIAPHAVPVYTAMPPSVITPVCESMSTMPDAGTVKLNHTSPPLYPAQPGAGIVPHVVLVAYKFVEVVYEQFEPTVSETAAVGLSCAGAAPVMQRLPSILAEPAPTFNIRTINVPLEAAVNVVDSTTPVPVPVAFAQATWVSEPQAPLYTTITGLSLVVVV